MQLSQSQLTTLRDWIIANNNGVFDMSAVSLLNAPASPAFTVWKTSVTNQEIMQNGFDWTRVDNLSVGKGRVWEWMFQFGSINPSKPNIRAGIEAVWVGTAPDLAVRAAVYGHCKRLATVAEKLFATGTGSDATPAIMGAGQEGEVTLQNVVDAGS